MEANVVAEGIRLAGTFNRPYQETIPLSKKTLIKGNLYFIQFENFANYVIEGSKILEIFKLF